MSKRETMSKNLTCEKEKLRKVALLSLANAEQYVKDAEFLVKKRSYGHAFALAVIGEEELAKAVMYYLSAQGIFGIEGKWRKDSRHHVGKQGFAFGIAFLYEIVLIMEEAIDFAQRKAKRNVARFKHIFEKKIATILQKEQKLFASKRGDIYEHLKLFEELQKKRERAMYVEADFQKMEAISPKSFKKSETRQYISHVKEIVEALRDEIKRKMKTQDKQVAIYLMKMVLSQYNKEGKQKLLEWYGLSIEDLNKFDIP
jgi:AbiV family abortive infection protein